MQIKVSIKTNGARRIGIGKTIAFLQLLLWTGVGIHAQKSDFDPDRKYHPDSLRNWTSMVFSQMEKSHPGFYRYTDEKHFDYLIDSTKQTIETGLTELEYYRKLKPLIAQIGCLHTSISLSKAYGDHLNSTQTMLPLEVFVDGDGKVLVSKNHSAVSHVPIGGELVAINGKPIKDILNTLVRAIPSDGYNQTEKILLLNHRFPFWYQTVIEAKTDFSVDILMNGSVTSYQLNGVAHDVFPTMDEIMGMGRPMLQFQILDDIAVLRIGSFAKTAIKKGGQQFKRFIKESFREIKESGVKDLIIDLRNNSGGTDSNAAFFASYFFVRPFAYWDRIEVTESIAMDVKGLDRIFFKKPQKRDGMYQWEKTWVTKEFDYYEEQKPAKHPYRGNTYILSNGLCLSSCADLIAVLSHNDKAMVVGQESGGGYQGNTSGMMPSFVIPTGIRVTMPLQKYTNAVDLTKNFGRGTIPDHQVEPDFEDWLLERDVEMEFVMQLIGNKDDSKD